ncbi:MAG: Fic family protein, partial [Gemmatimonadales bacterium]
MPRVSESDIRAELDVVEALIAQYPEGVARATLENAFVESQGRRIAKRTLLRRLERLLTEGRILPDGGGPQIVYRPGPALVLEPPDPEEGYVPLSREGAQVRGLMRRPMVEHKPVGYNPDFLRVYEPGVTWYLPSRVRDRLHELGRTPDNERPAGTYARDIFARLLIDLAWASSRLEGNTYTRLDTQNLLEFGQHAEGKDISEAQMILNHKVAIELVVGEVDRLGFNVLTLQSLHAALSENLVGDPADEGHLRMRIVDISGTSYRPLSIPQRIEEYLRVLLEKTEAIPDPFEQAFFVMVHIPYLQPFADVNKRTSRLAANLPLIKANLCPLSFVGVPERAYIEGTLGVYELNRVELLRDVFVWAYGRSCEQYRVVRDSMPEPNPIRLRYRTEMADVVRETVQSGAPPNTTALREWGEGKDVQPDDLDSFAEIALGLLLSLHEG